MKNGKWVDFKRPIKDEFNLYAHLEEYLNHGGRETQLQGFESDALFVVSIPYAVKNAQRGTPDPCRYSDKGFMLKIANLVVRYLAWSPRTGPGIKGSAGLAIMPGG
jgi:hypothetical protein